MPTAPPRPTAKIVHFPMILKQSYTRESRFLADDPEWEIVMTPEEAQEKYGR